MTTNSPEALSDCQLIDAVALAVHDERRGTAHLITLLAEFDARRLYLGEGCSSLFTYCTQVLRLSEHAAYHRIEAARAARQFPIILTLLRSGDVTLTAVAMLRPHLTPANHAQLLEAARHRSKRDVEHLIAGLAPTPNAIALIRRLPAVRSVALIELVATGGATTEPTPPKAADLYDAVAPVVTTCVSTSPDIRGFSLRTAPTPTLAPLSSDRYLLRVTSASNPRKAERGKKAVRNERYIPAEIRRTVWARDGGRCAFVGALGRCTETGRLEFHHLHPVAHGGPSTVANVALRCRAHNMFESESFFGAWPRA